MTNDVETIKSRLDIADVIREYLTLKQSGAHLKALCPFHHEKSPSFMVNRERQIWHCFGCNEGGDIFSFVQRIEHIDFREALKMLAEKAGIELTHSQKSEVMKDERTRLQSVVERVARVYHKILFELPCAKDAREYLKLRGVSPEMIREFCIGYAPQSWDALTQYLLKHGVSVEDCVSCGLTIEKNDSRKRLFDRFRGRIMFPLSDIHGRVVGFTGRVLVESERSGGKYVNSPESPIFHKGKMIYGLYFAKNAIKESGFVTIVEGQMDVIACRQHGFANTVAVSGTALTSEQLKILKRYTDEARFAFDADAAGQHAAERSIDTALAEGFTVKIISLSQSDAKDADECIKKNPELWRLAVDDAKMYMEYLFDALMPENARSAVLSDPKRKHMIAQKLLAHIAHIASAVERDHWIRKTALHLGISEEPLRDLLRRMTGYAQLQKSSPQSSATDVQEPDYQMRKMLEEQFMALLQDNFSAFQIVAQKVPIESITTSHLCELYKEWLRQYTESTEKQAAPFKDPTLELLISAKYSELNINERTDELMQTADRLYSLHLRGRQNELLGKIKHAETEGKTKLVHQLMKEYQNLFR